MDSNHRPHAYQACALTRLSYRPANLMRITSHSAVRCGEWGPAKVSIISWSEKWWTRPGSNRRPPGCKPGALPAELRAHINGTDASLGARFQSIAMLSHGSHSLSLAETGPPGCKPGALPAELRAREFDVGHESQRSARWRVGPHTDEHNCPRNHR